MCVRSVVSHLCLTLLSCFMCCIMIGTSFGVSLGAVLCECDPPPFVLVPDSEAQQLLSHTLFVSGLQNVSAMPLEELP